MLTKSRIIVLHTIKHSDSGVVVQCYSDTKGRTACYFYPKSKQSKSSVTFPLNILDVVLHSKRGGEGTMPLIKEADTVFPLTDIQTDIRKNAIALYMCELILRSVRESEPDPGLFAFLTNSVLILNEIKEGCENFHLHFTVNLCKLLGYMPQDNYSAERKHFNFTQAQFVEKYNEAFCFAPDESLLLHTILSTPLKDIPTVKCSGELRNRFLTKVLEYFSFHSALKTELKSLGVLRELFI